jgi:hypothetical protein
LDDRRPGCTDFPGCAAHSPGGCPRHVETLQQHYFSDDPRWKDLRSVELRDIGIRNSLLIIIDVKDGGSVRGTTSGALAVELRWIVGDGKEHAQQLAVSDFDGS